MAARKQQPIIELKNFVAKYGDTLVLKDICFTVDPGEIFVILGGSGCGKSTLLKHMIGLYPPASGEIWLDGTNIAEAGSEEYRGVLRRIGVGYQSGALFGSMSLLDNIKLPLREFTKLSEDAMNLIARMKLSLVGLADSPYHLPAEISGGMQKRAAIARAIALDPKIVFLDEPSAGLDPITSAGLDNLIRQLSRNLGITFVIVTHELASVYEITDRCIMLDKKTKGIIAEGAPADLRDHSDHPTVRAFFHREVNA